MTQIPSDDILEGLYILKIRESEKLKTVLELYTMEIHQKKAEPDCHRLKTRVIDGSLSSQEFGVIKPQYKRHKGRVVLRCDTVKDDSGAYAVFTEHGSPASQMTAAKVMDIISRPPGCAGQAADAVSAYTQVKMEDAPTLMKIPKVRMSRYLDTSTKTRIAQFMDQYGRLSCSS